MEVAAAEVARSAFVGVEDAAAVVAEAEEVANADQVAAAEEVGVNHYNHQAAAEH